MDRKEIEAKKQYLEGYERAVNRLKRSEERIQNLRLHQMGSAINMDGMPHAHNNSDLSAYAAALDQEEKRRKDLTFAYIDIYKKITNIIEELSDDTQKDVLTYRYVHLLDWNIICEKVGKSRSQINKIHDKGLENIKIVSASGQQV